MSFDEFLASVGLAALASAEGLSEDDARRRQILLDFFEKGSAATVPASEDLVSPPVAPAPPPAPTDDALRLSVRELSVPDSSTYKPSMLRLAAVSTATDDRSEEIDSIGVGVAMWCLPGHAESVRMRLSRNGSHSSRPPVAVSPMEAVRRLAAMEGRSSARSSDSDLVSLMLSSAVGSLRQAMGTAIVTGVTALAGQPADNPSSEFAKRVSVQNFQPGYDVSIEPGIGISPIVAGKVASVQTVAERWTYRAQPWGGIYSLPREAIVNSSSTAIAAIVSNIVSSARNAVNAAAISRVIADVDLGLVSVAGGNLIAGTNATFSEQAVSAAFALLLGQRDLAGNPINSATSPLSLVVPAALITAAQRLVTGQVGQAVESGQTFVLGRAFGVPVRVVPNLYMTSPSAWMLVDGRPEGDRPVTLAEVNGESEPTIDELPTSEYDGLRWRATRDFGVGSRNLRSFVYADPAR